MVRLVLREIARWVRGIAAPLAVVAAGVVTPTLLREPVAMLLDIVPDRAVSMTWMAAVVAAIAWLLTAGVRAATQPAKDTRASERLQELRERSAMPQHSLVFVTEVLWTSPAGQRLAAVDARTGEVREIWLAERTAARGAFALLVGTVEERRLIDHMGAREVAAARRHEQVSDARRCVHGARSANLARRVERKAASEVVRAAETLLS
ncbi:hypothetical protein DDP54_00850 (plasmid) [Cellulomonas sp. WB94]|uniref:hypothetical protein n=1 Tax=Cellulomonas sp. WB94 TaxID=2173174 RepID=UPI000D57F258|nr:hypothetical protein [Cellulomonas sp. WB94]PVU84427.1 hypothetical protein DDP54_00850 [Cellulomonas sp. WB94]